MIATDAAHRARGSARERRTYVRVRRRLGRFRCARPTLGGRSFMFLCFSFCSPFSLRHQPNHDPPSRGIRRRAFGATLPPPGVRVYFRARGVFPEPPLSRAHGAGRVCSRLTHRIWASHDRDRRLLRRRILRLRRGAAADAAAAAMGGGGEGGGGSGGGGGGGGGRYTGESGSGTRRDGGEMGTSHVSTCPTIVIARLSACEVRVPVHTLSQRS